MERGYGDAEHGSLRAQVFHDLEEEILSGRLKPGDTLAEAKISAKLGVSRTPVREAVGQLESEGLVKSIPNRGAVVVGVSQRDIEDIYTIRTHIEGLAAKWTAEKIMDSELEELTNIVELQEFYLMKGDLVQIWRLDSRFHELIHEYCRSNPLRNTLSQFHHYIARARRTSIENHDRAEASVLEHRLVLQAIAARDQREAERRMVEHIKAAKQSFLRRAEG